MPKVNYYLKNAPTVQVLEKLKKSKDKAFNELMYEKRPILMSVAFKGERFLYSTGKFISLKQWDRSTKRIKNTVDTSIESIADGEWLDEKKIKVEQFLKNAIQETRKIKKSDVAAIIFGENKFLSSRELSLNEILDDFLKNHRNHKGDPISGNTRKNYISVRNHLIKFQDSSIFETNSYSTEWVLDFKDYLSRIAKLVDNTTHKYIKCLKTFFKYLIRRGYEIKVDFIEIKTAETEQIVFALESRELQILENIQLENITHQQMRDIFLFQCYTGSRYSDINNIKGVDVISINEAMFWSYMSVKSDIELKAPLQEKAIRILNKYKKLNTPLPTYTNQALNREIKKIAKIAKLDRLIKQLEYRGGKRFEKIYLLYDVISSHTARKTFITISLSLGKNERTVRAITGHRDERSFRRYVALGTDSLLEVKEAWEKLK